MNGTKRVTLSSSCRCSVLTVQISEDNCMLEKRLDRACAVTCHASSHWNASFLFDFKTNMQSPIHFCCNYVCFFDYSPGKFLLISLATIGDSKWGDVCTVTNILLMCTNIPIRASLSWLPYDNALWISIRASSN